MGDMGYKIQLAANSFRLGQEGAGGNVLTALIDELLQTITDGQLNVDEAAFNVMIQNIVQAQLAGDYLYLADLLEYELLEYLVPD